ncbi:MAG TPA: metal ABC transporter substrate-binding protein [Candidimonas sp.]|nr:metal ABC transporter substrate-binding protein [Candidimonas sp.]
MLKLFSIKQVNRCSRRALLTAMSGAVVALAAPSVFAVDRPPLRVVASFSVLGDMVKEIGGEHVALTTIVGPNADAHSFEPTPQDVKALSQAQVLVINGLDFEAWLPRLINAAGFKGAQVLASEGIAVRQLDDGGHAHGAGQPHGVGESHEGAPDVDPHAWQRLDNGMIYARNIAEGLARSDPRRRSYYIGRAHAYIGKMKTLDTEIKQAIAAIPPDRRKVITSHDAFGYFAQAYGIEFISVAGLSSQAEPSAKEVAAIIDRAKKEGIAGVFIENITNSKLVTQIAKESGIKIGSTLYSDALSNPDRPAATYLGMFSWNAGQLIYVLKPEK